MSEKIKKLIAYYIKEHAVVGKWKLSKDFLQPVFLLIAIFIGIAINLAFPSAASDLEMYIVPSIFAMLFFTFLLMPFSKIGMGVKNHRFLFLVLSVNFMLTPIYAWLLGLFLLQNSIALWIGFLMALVTPCTDWYLIFTGMGKGDVPLCSSILPFNLILQLLLLPFYIFLFFGRSVPYDPLYILGIVAALFLMLALAQIVRYSMEKSKGETWIKNNFEHKLQMVPTMLLGVAIVFMFASWSSAILGNSLAVLQLLIPLLIFYFTIYPAGRILGRLFGFSRAGSVCIASTLTARNSPTVLPIAVLAFPEMPLVAITQIIITLVEIPVMLVLTSLSLKIDFKKVRDNV